LRLFFCYTR